MRDLDGQGDGTLISPEEWGLIAEALGLSERQLDVVHAIFADNSKPEAIADALGIKPSTAKTHIERLFQRLGVNSKVGVVIAVFRALLAIRAGQARREITRHGMY